MDPLIQEMEMLFKCQAEEKSKESEIQSYGFLNGVRNQEVREKIKGRNNSGSDAFTKAFKNLMFHWKPSV